MLGIQNALTKAPRLMSLAKTQTRSIVSAPPTHRIPFAEKVVLGIILYVGIIATPLYISANITKYRSKGSA